MLVATRVGLGLGMLAVRARPGAFRLRGVGAGPPGYSQRGLKLFLRFFGKMSPPNRQQQLQPQQGQPVEEKESTDAKSGQEHKHATDAGIVNPVNLPGTGIGMFGFGAGGGMDAVITTLIGITVGRFLGAGVRYVTLTNGSIDDHSICRGSRVCNMVQGQCTRQGKLISVSVSPLGVSFYT